MWNFWTGFLPLGVGLAFTAMLVMIMAVVYLLGCILIWKDERAAEAEKKRRKIRKVSPRSTV